MLANNTTTSASSNDSELWQQFRQGDRVAFQQLYQKYLQELFNYGCKVVPVRSIVTDGIQDMFVDIWHNRGNLSSTDNVKYYLFKALRRRLVRNMDKERKHRLFPVEQEVDVIFPFEDQLIAGQHNKEKLQQLRKAIGKLSDRQKEVISLIFYEGFSYEEASNLIGINLRSTYTLAWKALSILRKEITRLIILPFFIFLHFL